MSTFANRRGKRRQAPNFVVFILLGIAGRVRSDKCFQSNAEENLVLGSSCEDFFKGGRVSFGTLAAGGADQCSFDGGVKDRGLIQHGTTVTHTCSVGEANMLRLFTGLICFFRLSPICAYDVFSSPSPFSRCPTAGSPGRSRFAERGKKARSDNTTTTKGAATATTSTSRFATPSTDRRGW